MLFRKQKNEVRALTVLTPIGRELPPKRGETEQKSTKARRILPNLSARNYELADMDCALGWKDIQSSGNQAIFRHFETIRSRAQELERNNEYAQAFLNRLRNNVVGKEGISLQCRIKYKGGKQAGRLDKGYNASIEDYWYAAGKKKNLPTACGQFTSRGLQQYIITRLFVDGEVFILRQPGSTKNRFRYALKFIDPARVDCKLNRERGTNVNAIKMGVEVDKDDMPVAYWILNHHPNEHFVGGGRVSGRQHERIPASSISHIFKTERAGQVRGVTHLASAALKAHLLSQFEKACVISARNAAAKMGFFMVDQEKAEALGVLGNSIAEGEVSESVNDEAVIREDLTYGSIDQLPSYITDIKTFDPKTPPANFEEFEKRMIRGMSAGFGDQYHGVANDLEGVNYTSSRTGELSQRDVWQNWQNFLVEYFLETYFEEWAEIQIINQNVQIDAKKTREMLDFDRYVFKGRGWAWVDPKKQVEANAAAIENGFKTRRDVIYEESGRDFEEVQDDLAEEEKYMVSKGLNPRPFEKPIPEPVGKSVKKSDDEDAED
jgi:lambda family phage portal protein